MAEKGWPARGPGACARQRTSCVGSFSSCTSDLEPWRLATQNSEHRERGRERPADTCSLRQGDRKGAAAGPETIRQSPAPQKILRPHLRRHPQGRSEEARCPPRHAAVRRPRRSHCGAASAHSVSGTTVGTVARPSTGSHEAPPLLHTGRCQRHLAEKGCLQRPPRGVRGSRKEAVGHRRGLPGPGDPPAASGREDSDPSCASDEAGPPVPSPPDTVSEKASWNRRLRKLPNPVIHTQNVQIPMETPPACYTEKTRIPSLNLKSQQPAPPDEETGMGRDAFSTNEGSLAGTRRLAKT